MNESHESTEALIGSINDFVNIWNTLLTHPFNWKYDGTGLHEKAVRRFINIISYERNPLPGKFLVKQLLLMINLIVSYWDNDSFEVSVQPEDEVHTQVTEDQRRELRALVEAWENRDTSYLFCTNKNA